MDLPSCFSHPAVKGWTQLLVMLMIITALLIVLLLSLLTNLKTVTLKLAVLYKEPTCHCGKPRGLLTKVPFTRGDRSKLIDQVKHKFD